MRAFSWRWMMLRAPFAAGINNKANASRTSCFIFFCGMVWSIMVRRINGVSKDNPVLARIAASIPQICQRYGSE